MLQRNRYGRCSRNFGISEGVLLEVVYNFSIWERLKRRRLKFPRPVELHLEFDSEWQKHAQELSPRFEKTLRRLKLT